MVYSWSSLFLNFLVVIGGTFAITMLSYQLNNWFLGSVALL